MSPITVSNILDINVNDISFSQPKTMDNGGKMINIYHKKAPFVFKVPSMSAPYGISDWKMQKFSIDLSLTSEMEAVKSKFEEIEKKFIDEAAENSMKWIGRKEDPEVIEELFTSAIRYPRDKVTGDIIDKYPPTIKFQVPYKNEKFTCTAYNASKNTLSISSDTIPKKSMVAAVVHCSGIWVAGGKFGCTMKIEQMKVDANKNVLDKYAFMVDDDESVLTESN